MQTCKLLLTFLVALHCSQFLLAACVCSEKGTDYCQGCQSSSIVRPKPRYLEPSELNMSPIGDNCWCSKQLIEPAQLPKTCGKCKKQTTKTSCGCGSHSQSTSSYSHDSSYDSSSSSSNYHGYGYAHEKTQDDSAPADPISVSLANEAGKALNVPEAKLSYGFAKKPVEDKQEVYSSNVPEENLYQLNSEVITLQKPTRTKTQQEEEYTEEEEEQESTADEEETVPQLTYKQLGYKTEHYKNPHFKKINTKSYNNRDYGYDYGYDKVDGKVSVDCGYKPGRITSYRNSRRQELEGHY